MSTPSSTPPNFGGWPGSAADFAIELTYPMTPMQQAMLFESLRGESLGAYIQQLVLRCEESFDPDAWNYAVAEVTQCRPVLRSFFQWEGSDEPVQQVRKSLKPKVAVVEAPGLVIEKRDEMLATFLREDRRQGLDLRQGPLLRFRAFIFSPDDCRIVWTFHHGLLDGRAHLRVIKELFGVYDAYRKGATYPLESTAPFEDHVRWMRNRDLKGSEQFWRQKLAGVYGPTPLPCDERGQLHPPDQVVQEQQLELSSELTEQLEGFAIQSGVTLNTLIQAAWAVILARYSGETDVVFGATRACRKSSIPGSESIVGLLINTVPVRVPFKDNETVQDFLVRLRTIWTELRGYEHDSSRQIQSWSDVPSGLPLFESILIFERYRLVDGDFPGNEGGVVRRKMELFEVSNTPMALAVYGGQRLLFKLEYDATRFSSATIRGVLSHLSVVLEGMMACPDRPVVLLPILTGTEIKKVLQDWSQNQQPYVDQRPVHYLIADHCKTRGDAPALEQEGRVVTYSQLDALSEAVASSLREMGVGADSLIGLFLDRSIEMVVGMLGVLKAGAAYVPLDPGYPQERLEFIIQDTATPVVITRGPLAGRLPPGNYLTIHLDGLAPNQTSTPSKSHSLAKGTDLAYVIYTSGSTGKPKGVMIEHRALANYACAASDYYQVSASDRVLQFASMNFDASVEEIFCTLTRGGTLVLRTDEMISSMEVFTRKCAEWQISVISLPTAFWHEMAVQLASETLTIPSAVRLVIIGGERVLKERVHQWLDHVGRKARLINSYGPTETTVVATVWEAAESLLSPDSREVPIGRVLPNLSSYVLDRNLQPVPIGVPGELHIGGVGLSRGYLNRPELTADKFIDNPFESGSRLYKTGDLVCYLEDGNLEYRGRTDDQVKIRGFRIEIGEIESVLTQHPGVADCAVIVKQSEQGIQRLVAFCVPKGGVTLNVSGLRGFMKGQLPDYMLPAGYSIIPVLPTTPNGKIDRKALARREIDPDASQSAKVGPRDALEQRLIRLWERVFGVSPISVRDNFFDLGGHSLVAVRLFHEIERITGKNLPLVTLFKAPTIEMLADILRQQGWEPMWSSLVPIRPGGSRAPFYCVHGVGGNILEFLDLANYVDSDQPFYGIQAVGLNGKEPPLETVEAMATHHIQEIRSLQPRGPYYIGGSSFGGTVAYEIAQQLVAQGEHVALLAFFDTYGPGYPKTLPNVSILRTKWNRFKERVELHWGNFQATEANRKLGYVKTKAKRLRGSMRSRFRDLLARGKTTRTLPDAPDILPRAIRTVAEVSRKAADKYVPKPYVGRMTLFRATEQPRDIYEDRTLGWGALVLGGIEIYDTPGHHGAIVREPRVELLAQQLNESLARAQSVGK